MSNAVNLTDGMEGWRVDLRHRVCCIGGIALQWAKLHRPVLLHTRGRHVWLPMVHVHPASCSCAYRLALVCATLGVVALMTGHGFSFRYLRHPGQRSVERCAPVTYFKLSKGKRVFRMAPLHHHFELLGWSETQVVQRFWLIGLMFAMFGVAIALI